MRHARLQWRGLSSGWLRPQVPGGADELSPVLLSWAPLVGEEIGNRRCGLQLPQDWVFSQSSQPPHPPRGMGAGVGCPFRAIGRAPHGCFLYLLCSRGSCQGFPSDLWELGSSRPAPPWLPAAPALLSSPWPPTCQEAAGAPCCGQCGPGAVGGGMECSSSNV